MKRISILLFVIMLAFLWSANTGMAQMKQDWQDVLSPDSSGTNVWFVEDATSSDTGDTYIDITLYDKDEIWLWYKAEHAHADSAKARIYVYQCNDYPDSLTASAIETDYGWALVDSTDVADTLPHYVQLGNLGPSKYLLFRVDGLTATDDSVFLRMSLYPAWKD